MKIGIIGFGYLGNTLAEWHYSQDQLDYLVIRNNNNNEIAKSHFINNVNLYSKINQINFFADINILAVKDSEIETVVNEILQSNIDLSGKIFLHCSGVLGKDCLFKLKEKGAVIAAAHPYQTFWSKNPDCLNNVSWLVDVDSNKIDVFDWIMSTGGKIFELKDSNGNEINRIGYHLSAVISSNYMNLIFYLSKQIAKDSGINPEDFIPEIARTTLENNINNLSGDNEFPLTGPVARGDLNSIKMHIDFLKNENHLLNSYIYLSLATLEIARKTEILSDLNYTEIKEFLLNSIF